MTFHAGFHSMYTQHSMNIEKRLKAAIEDDELDVLFGQKKGSSDATAELPKRSQSSLGPSVRRPLSASSIGRLRYDNVRDRYRRSVQSNSSSDLNMTNRKSTEENMKKLNLNQLSSRENSVPNTVRKSVDSSVGVPKSDRPRRESKIRDNTDKVHTDNTQNGSSEEGDKTQRSTMRSIFQSDARVNVVPETTITTDTMLEFDISIPRNENEIQLNLKLPFAKEKKNISAPGSTDISGFARSVNLVVSNWTNVLETGTVPVEYLQQVDMRQLQSSVENYQRNSTLKLSKDLSSVQSSMTLLQNSTNHLHATNALKAQDSTYNLISDTLGKFRTLYRESKEDLSVGSRSSPDFMKSGDMAKRSYDSNKKLSEFQPRTEIDFRTKFEEMRVSSWKQKEFEDKIQSYKDEERNQKNVNSSSKYIIKKYVEDVSRESYTSEYLLNIREKKKEIRASHHNLALERKKLIDVEDEIKGQQLLLLKQMKIERAERERELLPKKKKLQKQQTIFLPVLLLTKFLSSLEDIWIGSLQQRIQEEKEINAKTILQTKLYPLLVKKREERVMKARSVINRQLMRWIINHRIRRKRRAISLLKQFFQDAAVASSIPRTVSMFFNSLRMIQHRTRLYLIQRRCQLISLSHQWHNLESKMTMECLESDLALIRTKLIEKLQNLAEKVKASAPKSNQQIIRGTKASHMQKQSAKGLLESKRSLRSLRECLITGLAKINLSIPGQRKNKTIETSKLISILKDPSYSNFQLKDILLQSSKLLRIALPARVERTDEHIQLAIIKEDMLARIHRHYQVAFKDWTPHRGQRDSTELSGREHDLVHKFIRLQVPRYRFLNSESNLRTLILRGQNETLKLTNPNIQ